MNTVNELSPKELQSLTEKTHEEHVRQYVETVEENAHLTVGGQKWTTTEVLCGVYSVWGISYLTCDFTFAGGETLHFEGGGSGPIFSAQNSEKGSATFNLSPETLKGTKGKLILFEVASAAVVGGGIAVHWHKGFITRGNGIFVGIGLGGGFFTGIGHFS